jgi:hypothetical protein
MLETDTFEGRLDKRGRVLCYRLLLLLTISVSTLLVRR